VSASEIGRILEPVAPPRSVLRLDDARSLVMLSGSADELAMMGDLIQLFDVDWMRGQSFAIFPVKSSAPEEIAKELEVVFGTSKEGISTGSVKFLPNKRLSAVLVVAARASHIEKVRIWIEKLDRQAERSEERMFIYKIQNRPAEQLATLLAQVLSQQPQDRSQQSLLSPRYEQGGTASQSQSQPASPGVSSSSGFTGANPITLPRRIDVPSQSATDTVSTYSSPTTAGQSRLPQGTRIVADENNNAILVYATPKEWERIQKILERLDLVATQVLIEAVIAEVTLNDELKFGLRWYMEKGSSKFKFSDAASGAVSAVFPGFSYFFSAQDIQVALNAVSGITDVRVVSAPSLMVTDNRTAKLQVGDQVPIVTQTAQSVTNPDAPVVNAVTLKDTGIILSVTPRVSDSGRVTLEIEQEVSSVAKTTSSGIDSPTIQQRKIKTTVGVLDGQVLALGGLIQQRENTTKTQVPLLGSIPIIGNAFRNKEDRIEKTELLIFIRPRVVRNQNEARQVTEEFRSQLDLHAPRRPAQEPRLHRDLRRLAQ
jgi:general secretion pathway protein D